MTVLRPRFSLDSPVMAPMRAMAAKLEGDPESNLLKHAFLPERWPSKLQPRSGDVQSVLDGAFAAMLPPAPTDWRVVMPVSGWDNAINRMMSKTCGNLKVHAAAQLPKAVRAYLGCVPMDPETPRWLLIDTCALGRPRPLVAHNEDWAMATELRRILAGVPLNGTEEWHVKRMLLYNVPDKVDFSAEVLLLHFFLVRYGVAERTYLPLVSRGRKYAYIDAKVARFLFPANKKVKEKKQGVKKADSKAGPSNPLEEEDGRDDEPTVSVGELMGLTPAAFNRRRRQIRREVRRRYRQNASNADHDAVRRKRLKKHAKRWQRIGASAMPKNARIDSIETDGVGLRMVMKTPTDIAHHVRPIEDAEETKVQAASSKRGKKRAPAMTEVAPRCPHEPVMVAMDLGRAKLFAAAISRRAIEKPTTVVLTRRKYYYAMRHGRQRRWEQARMVALPEIRAAVTALSSTGGVHNSDGDKWLAYLAAETQHRQALDDEFVANVERAKWKMVMHRGKRRCLDACVKGMLRTALKGVPLERPLVVGVGNAGFPSNGSSGELPAPTSELSKAMKRALVGIRATGRCVTTQSLDEFLLRLSLADTGIAIQATW